MIDMIAKKFKKIFVMSVTIISAKITEKYCKLKF